MTITPDKPHCIDFLLSVHPLYEAGAENFRPTCAVGGFCKETIELLVARSALFWMARKLGAGLCQMDYDNYGLGPMFFEKGARDEPCGHFTQSQREDIDAIFDGEGLPINGFKEVPFELPGWGNVQYTKCRLVIIDTGDWNRPDMVDFFWIAHAEHTGIDVRTTKLKQEDVQALLPRLS